MKKSVLLSAYLLIFTGMYGQILSSKDTKSLSGIGNELQERMIWTGNDDGKSRFTVFRKTIDVAELNGATIHLFADTKYVLWINGREILRGPCRFDPVSPSFDSMTIGPFLNPGKNVVVVMVMSHGSNGKMMDHEPGLTAGLEIEDKSNLKSWMWTDTSWKWNNKTRFLPPIQTWGFVCDRIDARIDDGDWTQLDFDDSAWELSVKIDGKKWGPLQPRSIPLLSETNMSWKSLNKSGLPVILNSGQAYIIKSDQMIQGYPVISLNASKKIFPFLEEGAVIRFEFGYTGDSTKVSDTYGASSFYITREGSQVFSPTDSYGFRFLKVEVLSGNVLLEQIKLVDRRYPYLETGSFKCSEPFLNELWKRSALTIKLNCEDGHMDCALREKTEWMGDAALLLYPFSKKIFAISDSSGVPRSDSRLMGSLLRHIAQSQEQIRTFRLFSPSAEESLLRQSAQNLSDSGMFKARHPNDFFDIHAYIEDYSCLWVQALREVYETTGKPELVNELWQPLKKQMNWFIQHRSSNGLVYGREFVWFDNPLIYCYSNGATLNAFVYKALLDASFLATVIGDNKAGLHYKNIAGDILKSFNKSLWMPSKLTYSSGISNGKQMMPTSHAALMALNRGIVPENRVQKVREYLFRHYQDQGIKYTRLTDGTNLNSRGIISESFFNSELPVNGIQGSYTTFWLLAELFRNNRDTEALNLIRAKWDFMMKDTLTGTLTEDFRGGDDCHNSGAIAGFFLSSNVLGVSERFPVSSKIIEIKPKLGDLTRAEGTVVTIHGPVHVKWVKQTDGLFFSIDIPQGTKALISLPYNKSFNKILVNMKEVLHRIDKNNLIFTTESNITDGIYK